MAPLGSPVVPPVYCMTAMSRSGSISTAAGRPSLAVSLLNLTCAGSLGIVATSRRLNSANSARLGSARAPLMAHTTTVSRQVSARRRATLGYRVLRFMVTMIRVPESSIWRATSRSA